MSQDSRHPLRIRRDTKRTRARENDAPCTTAAWQYRVVTHVTSFGGRRPAVNLSAPFSDGRGFNRVRVKWD